MKVYGRIIAVLVHINSTKLMFSYPVYIFCSVLEDK